jgi:hypothetical protein
MRAVAVLGVLACVVGGAVLGFLAATFGALGFSPVTVGIAGLAAGCIVAMVTFGVVLLLIDIAENARRSREILERQLG